MVGVPSAGVVYRLSYLAQKNKRDTCSPLGPRTRVGDGRSDVRGEGGRACAAAFAGAMRSGRVSAGLRCKRVRAHAQDATRPRMCAVGLIVQRSVGSPWRGGAGLPALGVWAEGLRHGRCYLEQ